MEEAGSAEEVKKGESNRGKKVGKEEERERERETRAWYKRMVLKSWRRGALSTGGS